MAAMGIAKGHRFSPAKMAQRPWSVLSRFAPLRYAPKPPGFFHSGANDASWIIYGTATIREKWPSGHRALFFSILVSHLPPFPDMPAAMPKACHPAP